MPPIAATPHSARITWLGHVAPEVEGIGSAPRDRMTLTWEGCAEDRHAGVNRPACVRVKALHPENTEIRNVRQLSLVSAEELARIAAEIGLETVDPGWLGASVVVEGLRDFTHLPPSSRLQAEDGATLVIDMLNAPCHLPGREIEAAHPGHGKAFKRAAEGRRGVTAWVERPGQLTLGGTLKLFVPTQRAWEGAAMAEAEA